MPKFQSTHPRGVRLDDLRGLRNSEFISIHAPTWGATPSSNPHRRPPRISIHAPTWGATEEARRPFVVVDISIHAPTWGATAHVCTHESGSEFQSTHPRGVRRLSDFRRYPKMIFQSTHPRGVRHRLSVDRLEFQHFNPRTHVGCDPLSVTMAKRSFSFQSTHPRGVRQKL